jgi:hypothetical protein
MHSQFDSPLKVVNGVVRACGELGWQHDETEAVVTATITQKGHKIVGTASSPPRFKRPKKEWMLQIRPSPRNRKFKKGPAHAVGVIHAVRGDTVDVFHWSQEVELKPR